MIIATNLRKAFGSRVVLNVDEVTITPGCITVLLGPSGSGKSTLLRALSLLEPPDQGSITIDGQAFVFPQDPQAAPLVPPWPKLTIVFQQLFLWPHLTIRQNITLPLQNTSVCENKVRELVDLLALSEFLDRYPNEVSLGQRQRTAIARALALNPTYLLLDEITSALDVEYVAALLEHLKTLRSVGTAILLVTHLIGFAKRAADQVLFMEDGRILENGGTNLLLQPRTERLARFLSLVDIAS